MGAWRNGQQGNGLEAGKHGMWGMVREDLWPGWGGGAIKGLEADWPSGARKGWMKRPSQPGLARKGRSPSLLTFGGYSHCSRRSPLPPPPLEIGGFRGSQAWPKKETKKGGTRAVN